MNSRIYFAFFIFLLSEGIMATANPLCPASPSEKDVLGTIQNGKIDWCFPIEPKGGKSNNWGFIFYNEKIDLVSAKYRPSGNNVWYQLDKLKSPLLEAIERKVINIAKKYKKEDIFQLVKNNLLDGDVSDLNKTYTITLTNNIKKQKYRYTTTLILKEYTPPSISAFGVKKNQSQLDSKSWLKKYCMKNFVLGYLSSSKTWWCDNKKGASGNASKEWGLAIHPGQDTLFKLIPFTDVPEGGQWYPLKGILIMEKGKVIEEIAIYFLKKMEATDVINHIEKALQENKQEKTRPIIAFTLDRNSINENINKFKHTKIFYFGSPRTKRTINDHQSEGENGDGLLTFFVIGILLLTVFVFLIYHLHTTKKWVFAKKNNRYINPRNQQQKLPVFDEYMQYYNTIEKSQKNDNQKSAIEAIHQAVLIYDNENNQLSNIERKIAVGLEYIKKVDKNLPFQNINEHQLDKINILVGKLPTEVSIRSDLSLFQAIEDCIERLSLTSAQPTINRTVKYKISAFISANQSKSPDLDMLYSIIIYAFTAFLARNHANNPVTSLEKHTSNDIKKIISTSIEKEAASLLKKIVFDTEYFQKSINKIINIGENISSLKKEQCRMNEAISISISTKQKHLNEIISSLKQHEKELEYYISMMTSTMGESATTEIKKLQYQLDQKNKKIVLQEKQIAELANKNEKAKQLARTYLADS